MAADASLVRYHLLNRTITQLPPPSEQKALPELQLGHADGAAASHTSAQLPDSDPTHRPERGNLLLELETTDWKFSRRFRLVTVHSGAISFTDARFILHHAHSGPEAPHTASQAGDMLEDCAAVGIGTGAQLCCRKCWFTNHK